MTKSLDELSYFINTGKSSNNEQVCKPRWDFGSKKYRTYLDSVCAEISKILEVCNLARYPKNSDILNLTQANMATIDASKNKIKKLTSSLFNNAA
jgi:hypothetical protein